MTILNAVILGIIEGLTEFLPISSTGHMILASSMMRMAESNFVKTFEIAIQLGAIAAIVVLYSKRFITNWPIYKKLIIAFIPTGVAGLLFYKLIKAYLFNPVVVAAMLILGGVVLILVDKKLTSASSKYQKLEDVKDKDALKIGVIQSISMIPGVSRAAATILGGVFSGFDKKQATEFSFLLAVPTMLAATGYDLLKNASAIDADGIKLLAIGFVVAFVSAWLAVKIFIKFIESNGFKFFGYYRIALGIIFLLYFLK